MDIKPAVVKIDCLQTDDKRRFQREKIPIKVGISADMCPDHFNIYNTYEMIEWAERENADVLIVETAGLCLRCSPYTDKCLAVCVVDVTSGPNAPLKAGPLLTTADVVITTKGDLVSQAEREVFRERICQVNPNCKIIEANGLSGLGSAEFGEIIRHTPQLAIGEDMILRHNPPLAVCILCTGELRVNKKYHCGILRNLNSNELNDYEYEGE
jgi:Ni2+-binding GTPase involved in maturation of urease and hydrogenase